MRLTTVLIIASLVQVSAATFGQRISLNQLNVPLDNVLKEIRKQSGYDIFYNSQTISRNQTVSVVVNNASIQTTLETAFKGLNLTYEIEGRTISIKRKEPSFLDKVATAFASISVRGVVTDSLGRPLPGATVKVKGTVTQVSTNNQGAFYIANVDEDAFLVITYLGYEPREVKALNNIGTIQLKALSAQLEEVEVTFNTGYQQLSPERTTGSFTRIDNQLINRSVSTNILDRIRGVASGVLFDNNLDNANDFSIRGRSTIFANTNPLIILDNFPYEGDLSTINPNDIEDITILKDASAASIWGARAGNGVVVLTSKKGKLNKLPAINFRSDVNIGQKQDLYSRKDLNTSEFIDVSTYLFDKGYYDGAINSGFQRLGPLVELLLQKRTNPALAGNINSQIDALRSVNVKDDLLKYWYRAPVNQQYSVNVNGGGNVHSYYLSAGYDKNFQDVEGGSDNRLSIRADNSFSFLKNKLKLNIGINFTNSGSRQSVFNPSQVAAMPYLKLADDSGNPLNINLYRNDFINSATQAGKLLSYSYYPLNEIKNIGNKGENINYVFSPAVSYNILEGLDLSFTYQYLKAQRQSGSLYNMETFYTRDMINTFSILEQNGSVTRNIPLGSIYGKADGSTTSEAGRVALNYQKRWAKHSVSGFASSEVRDLEQNDFSETLYGYDENTGTIGLVDYRDYFQTLFGGFSNIGGSAREVGLRDRFVSYLASGSYSYDDKYIFTGSIRKDQSNLFGVKANQKGVPLWSAGLAYVISKEKFYNVKWLSELKLRLTTGYSGNVDKSISAYLTMAAASTNFFSNRQATLLNPPNDNLRWERVRQTNFAVDFSLFKARISGSFDYYWKYSKDVMGDSPMPASSGVTLYRGNSADVSGGGYDFTLTTQNLNGKFNWNSTLLFSHNTDKIEVYKVKNTSLGFKEGYPYNALFSYRFAGLDAGNGDPLGYLNGTVSKDWAAINREFNTTDYKYHGSAVPTYFGSLRNDFEYRGISLSINLVYKLGYFFRRESIDYGLLGTAPHSDYNLRWQNPGDELKTNVPSLVYPAVLARESFYKNAETLVEKGDHIRFQDIQLGYTLNKSTIKGLPFQSVKFYSYINNLGVIWAANSHKLDPDSRIMNAPTTVAFGINVGF